MILFWRIYVDDWVFKGFFFLDLSNVDYLLKVFKIFKILFNCFSGEGIICKVGL